MSEQVDKKSEIFFILLEIPFGFGLFVVFLKYILNEN